MESISLADLIRAAFVEAVHHPEAASELMVARSAEPVLSAACLSELPQLVRRPSHPADAGEVLAAAVLMYQTGSRSLWGPVILEMLAPALVELRASLYAGPACVTDDDLSQQLLVEALAVAAAVNASRSHWIKQRITRRVRTRLVRWLRIEERESGSGDEPGVDLSAPATEASQSSADPGRAALVRMAAGGERLSAIAAESGIEMGRMRYLVRRARAELRRERAA